MHEVTKFHFNSQEVRVLINESGEPHWVAKDVCDVLGYANSRDAITKLCRKAGVAKSDIRSGGQKREVACIDEGNLYRLIIKSTKKESEPFESWVCDEVLPSIRKTGTYNLPECQADKTVDIRHFRSPVSPSGLDIRYTLDLTKVVMQPNAKSLALLERVAGLDLSDLIEDMTPMPDASISGIISAFIAKCCHRTDDHKRVSLKLLFAAYKEWFISHQYPGVKIAHRKQLSAALVAAGYDKRNVGGLCQIYGIGLVVEGVTV